MENLIPVFDKNAAYIWASYGIAFSLIGFTILLTAFRARAAVKARQAIDALSEEARP